MRRWLPCKRRDFLRRLRKMGFDGPYSGARHQFMVYGSQRLTVPSNNELSVPQLREVGAIIGRAISANEWNQL